DPTGWRMASAQGEQPRFVRASTQSDSAETPRARGDIEPSVPGDENWDGRFAFPGTDYNVNAIAISGTDVYMGGYFTTAGGTPATRIARWDATTNQWYPLGGGTSGGGTDVVYAIATSGMDVYVGGWFTTVGGVSANKIARWNTTANQWYPL